MNPKTTAVAQVLTRVLDDAIAEADAFYPEVDPEESSTEFIAEIGAQLHHLLGGSVEFVLAAGDGTKFTVRVSEGSLR